MVVPSGPAVMLRGRPVAVTPAVWSVMVGSATACAGRAAAIAAATART